MELSILEDQLVRVLEQNQELVNLNTDLQKQVQHLKHVTVGNDERGRSTSSLGSSDSLDSILKQMRDASEKRKELEQLRSEALKQLREKQSTLKNETSQVERAKSLETVEALQSKIRELEKKTELQNVRHEELMIEMAAMKKSLGAKGAASGTGQVQWKSACKSSHQEVQTSPDSIPASPDFDSARLDCMSRLGALAFEGLYSYQHNLGYRSSTMTQRAQNVPSCQTSTLFHRPHITFTEPCLAKQLTRHRSLSNFAEHDSAYDHLFATPHGNHLVWNDNYPASKYMRPASASEYPTRSLSQTNIPCRMNSFSNPIDSQFRGNVDQRKLNYWGLRNPQMLSEYEHSNNEFYWPKPLSYSSDSNQSLGPYRKSQKKSKSIVQSGFRNLEKWPKSLESLPKTPTDYRGDNNLGNPAFPSDGLRTEHGRQPLTSYATKLERAERTHFPCVQRPLPADSIEIDRIMAKIEQDNRVLAELDKTRANVGGLPSAANLELGRSSGLSSVLGQMSNFIPGQVMPMGLQGMMPSLSNPYMVPGPSSQASVMPFLNYGQSKRVIPPAPTSVYDLDDNRMAGTLAGLTAAEQAQLQQLVQQQPSTDNAGLPIPDMLDIPGKGRCFVYIARFSYDPFQQSLNENPESELSINAGDYLLVWGNIDDDGFCDSETLDGRRGLVPSNFIQKLVGDDLLEFHHSVLLQMRDADDSNSTTVPHDIDLGAHNHDFLGEGVYRRTDAQAYLDLEAEMLLDDDDPMVDSNTEGPVPAPKQLTLERQLNKSVLIGWNHPDSPYPAPIESYHVYVDGVLKTTVKSIERPRALVEGVDSNRPHRISVRSVTQNRRTSRDAACTMVIGKDVPPGPTCVKASTITSTSAVISWLPSNSNHQHVVSVNNVQVRTVKPGIYRHTITGLAPNTVYRVSVRAKNIRAPSFDEKNPKQLERLSCHMDFRTLSKGKGLPEAPCDVQVEPGPQDGTLLVTWAPVCLGTITPITGYAVYADGKKVTDVDSPTGDHALIDIGKLVGLNPKQVTVRTKSRDAQSGDSAATPIPQHILRGKSHSKEIEKPRYPAVAMHRRSTQQRTRVDQMGQVVIEPEENLSDKEIYPHMKIPAIEITKDSASEGAFSEDDFIDGRGMARSQQQMGQGYDSRNQPIRGHDPRRNDRGRGGVAPMPRDSRDQQYYGEGPRGVGRGAVGPYRAPHGRGGPVAPQQNMARCPPDRKVRWFVALFDYDPTTMSPNPDACEEELPFNEGDSIKVVGEKDADGFYWGECKGKKGFVPHNMVTEMQENKQGAEGRGSDRWGDTYQNMPMRKMVALYDYDPHELSPNVDAEVELTFQTGDIIYVYGDMDEDGFFMGEVEGVRGLVPSNFLTDAPPDYGEGSSGTRGGRGHGPGARGPPPPPRNDPAHNRRKDTCPTQTPRPLRGGMGRGQMGMGLPGHPQGGNDLRGDPRRGGKGRGMDPQYNLPNQYSDNQSQMQMQQQQQQPQQQQQQQQPQRQVKGGPSVVPDFVIPNNKDSPTQPPPQSNFLPQSPFQAPNIMGKLSELTSTGSGAVEAGADLLSKGKELIFMKFGLGGKS